MRHHQLRLRSSRFTRGSAPWLLAVTFLFGAGLGCGDVRVVTDVDVASFLPAADTNPSYGVNPPIPPGVPPVSIAIGPNTFNIPDGLDELAEVEEADLGVRAIVVNETGTGQLDLVMYFGRSGENPFANAPAAIFSTPLVPGTATIIEQTVELTPEIQGMLADSEIRFAYEVRVDGSQSSNPLLGSVLLEKMNLRIVHNASLGS